MDNNIYLKTGIYQNGDKELLFIAVPGYFASSAWTISDKEYNETSGSKFEAITSDDAKSWMLDRYCMRRVRNDDELNRLLEESCEEFKQLFNEL